MTEKLQQTIKEEIAGLPQEMQEAVNALDWIKMAEKIGLENQLEAEEIEDFQLETLLVLIGAAEPEYYAVNIENHVNITQDKAVKIASAAVREIFIPINNTIEESIKKNLKNRNPDWRQTIDFVLSGGNYATFLTKSSDTENRSTGKENMPTMVTPPTLTDIQANAQKMNQPDVSRPEDMRKKLVI